MKKVILRADDLGLSKGVNYGIKEAINSGLVKSVGFMVNMEDIQHGYNLIKEYDLALGLHTNFCLGKPLSNPNLIPSLVNGEEFCSSREIRSRKEDTINFDEAVIEIEAQLLKFKEITGRYPDYFECHAIKSNNFFKALKYVADKYDLFYENVLFDQEFENNTGIKGIPLPNLNDQGIYDFYENINQYKDIFDASKITVIIFHPGYMDQFLIDHSSFTFIRPYEVSVICSETFKKWIKDNDIQLIDFRDVQ